MASFLYVKTTDGFSWRINIEQIAMINEEAKTVFMGSNTGVGNGILSLSEESFKDVLRAIDEDYCYAFDADYDDVDYDAEAEEITAAEAEGLDSLEEK